MAEIQILVVEDSKMFADAISGEIRSRLCFDSVITTSLEETKKLLEKGSSNYFLAVLDLDLIDAHDEQILDYVISKGIPSIVFTGNVSDEVRERILSRKVVDYVLKESTQDVDNLVRVIQRIYKNQLVKVMVVDDPGDTRRLFKSLLSMQKYVVLEAANGEEALEVLEQNPDVKLVITGSSMPEMDGFQLVSEIRKKYRSDRMAIIGICPHGSGILSAKFLKKGANDFVNKPFTKEELYCRVNQNIEMLEKIEAIRDASNKDSLTNLYNRRYFFDLGRKIFENARRGNLDMTIAVIDIDHFKRINDTYGHEAGDMALKCAADVISKNIRKTDLLARLGGVEFCVLATNMKKEKTFSFFDTLRKRIKENEFKVGSKVLPIKIALTVSIGVTTRIGDSLEATIDQADQLLYQAKQSGRNKVVVDNT
ncbi:MAG: diguanylate cyclase [Candidatus Aminicenantes bacterium]|nr:diguanylate cyclase [Candidatus Aminicenantes bacterium]NIM84018.1 diguanylate cyclase [Candidatus Aminicenantes bacterium]NIN23496.1 diguanylate cyclase [Candidatus Aminicenantes bacterium]NIN47201.1 diguanylate cyclase [Candidatus Aminicenantes bacterium]NIN90125.1 diguanylate cyclase [Candidatus Aminicenantes bacterium]